MKITISHVGSGRTNPELWGLALRLQGALAPCVEPTPPDGHDFRLREWEEQDYVRYVAN